MKKLAIAWLAFLSLGALGGTAHLATTGIYPPLIIVGGIMLFFSIVWAAREI